MFCSFSRDCIIPVRLFACFCLFYNSSTLKGQCESYWRLRLKGKKCKDVLTPAHLVSLCGARCLAALSIETLGNRLNIHCNDHLTPSSRVQPYTHTGHQAHVCRAVEVFSKFLWTCADQTQSRTVFVCSQRHRTDHAFISVQQSQTYQTQLCVNSGSPRTISTHSSNRTLVTVTSARLHSSLHRVCHRTCVHGSGLAFHSACAHSARPCGVRVKLWMTRSRVAWRGRPDSEWDDRQIG